MKLTNRDIGFYVDTMIVETLLTDSHLVKTAQQANAGDLISKVTTYFGNQIDPNDKSGSLLNILAPGAVSMALGAMGLPWLGILLSLCMRVFNIDVKSILSSIYDKIKGPISAGQQMTSQQVDGIVNEAVQAENKPATEQEAEQASQTMQKQNHLRDARFLKLAMIAHEQDLYSEAKPGGFLSGFSSRKGTTVTLLGAVLRWIFKIAIASAGFMVAGDAINKFMGRPNALDGTVQNGKPVPGAQQASEAIPAIVPKQTKFPVNPGYHAESKNGPNNPWIENIRNDKGSIASLVLSWAKEVYPGLNGLDSIVQNTAGFQTIVETITWDNKQSQGASMIFIPGAFTSKKSVVDHFIDEVAEKAP